MDAKIRHMVVFNLKHPKDSDEAKAFIRKAKETFAQIPSARNVMQCHEVSPKNDFDYGFSFDFMQQSDYEAYNSHPLHVAFVRDDWNTQVTKFMEIDFEEIAPKD